MNNDRIPLCRGRFAPSPTGPLHFGSLVAAVGSYLEAKSQNGEWLVRIDDLDLPRCVAIFVLPSLTKNTLEAFGMGWDGEIVHQSRRDALYCAALAKLENAGALYPCACTRKEIADSSIERNGAMVYPDTRYPGICRNGLAPGKKARAVRLRVDQRLIEFQDGVRGRLCQQLELEVGDFVVRRADGLYAYQLATVVDDAAQGITQVVRGGDLLDSTPRQIYLQTLLGLPVPDYAHLPVAVNAAGEKLSKQTSAPAVEADRPVPTLFEVVRFLGQQPPAELREADLDSFWLWAMKNWRRENIPPVHTIQPRFLD